MHAVIRKYAASPDVLAEARPKLDQLKQTMQQSPGFVAYYFLETGDGKATALRFDYEHPPVPPTPSRHWHVAKWLFNRLYWVTVPQGRIPERAAKGGSES